MKSIRAKINLCLSITVLAALLAVGMFSIVSNYTSTLSTVNQMMKQQFWLRDASSMN